MLIVNGRTLRVLEQPELADSNDDEVFFNTIREVYLMIRNDSPPSFHRDTPVLVQKAVRLLHELSRAMQKLLIRAFTILRMGWLVWWMGDVLLYIPTAANFVKVRFA
jgi:hypothetical protein